MNRKSGRALMWFSLILMLIGFAIGSPAGSVFVLALAALSAAGPVISGPRVPRIVGIVVLVLSLAVTVAYLPAAKEHMDKYKSRSGKVRQSSAVENK